MYTCTINILTPAPGQTLTVESISRSGRAAQAGSSMGSTKLLLWLGLPAVAGSTSMPTAAPTEFQTPPFNVAGNTTSTCIAPPGGVQRTPDGSGRCAASWLYERDREPWVPGATGCLGRANFGCQKCDGNAHPWCEAVDEEGEHAGWCYCSDEDTAEESTGMSHIEEWDSRPSPDQCAEVYSSLDGWGPISTSGMPYRRLYCESRWKYTQAYHESYYGGGLAWQAFEGCVTGNAPDASADSWCEAVDISGQYVGWCVCGKEPTAAPTAPSQGMATRPPTRAGRDINGKYCPTGQLEVVGNYPDGNLCCNDPEGLVCAHDGMPDEARCAYGLGLEIGETPYSKLGSSMDCDGPDQQGVCAYCRCLCKNSWSNSFCPGANYGCPAASCDGWVGGRWCEVDPSECPLPNSISTNGVQWLPCDDSNEDADGVAAARAAALENDAAAAVTANSIIIALLAATFVV